MVIKAKNLDGYGAPPIDWERVRAVLSSDITQAPDAGGPNRHTMWLTTINPDGSPHVTPVGGGHVNGAWYFTSGPGTRKSRNLAADPRCSVSIATHPFDLVLEGSAGRVTDHDELRSVADEYNRDGWPAQVNGEALTAEFSAPSAGPPPWFVYKIEPETVFAFGTAELYGATRFDLRR
ncbi:pyridoxamine 5'-phosphate oxidase family protein [Mycobacterium sp. NPDC048908]|uniref:pyridoxamine 5'-phosphate oxidase family protein n=1 Tax=Mycobacterium sp. NPDC048908 TaxID=3364292 RepID=UPI0037123A25